MFIYIHMCICSYIHKCAGCYSFSNIWENITAIESITAGKTRKDDLILAYFRDEETGPEGYWSHC